MTSLQDEPSRDKRPLQEFEVLTFDCYGTLIDWETGLWDALQPLFQENSYGDLRRDDALKHYAEIEHRVEADKPTALYSEILETAHAALTRDLGLRENRELDAAFGSSVEHWPAFPDTAEALRRLKEHYRLVILSNVHVKGIAASNRKLGVEFDAIYTAEAIGSYKPSRENFDYLIEHLQTDFGIQQNDILHTAQSLFHDHVPAREIGLANAWIDRQRLSLGGSSGATAAVAQMPEFDFVFFTLEEMADAVSAEAEKR